jgi:hypothetical protein
MYLISGIIKRSQDRANVNAHLANAGAKLAALEALLMYSPEEREELAARGQGDLTGLVTSLTTVLAEILLTAELSAEGPAQRARAIASSDSARGWRLAVSIILIAPSDNPALSASTA